MYCSILRGKLLWLREWEKDRDRERKTERDRERYVQERVGNC